MATLARLIAILVLLMGFTATAPGQTLRVKEGRSAILKEAPSGNARQLEPRLPSGTTVSVLDEALRYYKVRVVGEDPREGWSYKGNFVFVETADDGQGQSPTAENLLARKDVLKIIIIDVEVGDATLIVCPEENGRQDVILIDTGEDDSSRIMNELEENGFDLHAKPITVFIITHYDYDHMGDAREMIPLAQRVYDHGDNIKEYYKESYLGMVNRPEVNRQEMKLDYAETFSGGVTMECVAVNRATDFDRENTPSPPSKDNPNSIAVIVSFDGFDYFTGGDLTFGPEKTLATGIQNCDVYHVNHHGSSATSSNIDFVKKLDPEVSVASNGTRHGHPTKTVAQRLLGGTIRSKFYQTNVNKNHKAHQPPQKYVADDTFHTEGEDEDAEGAKGTIRILVDPRSDYYYIVMDGLPLEEATFPIEK